MRFQQVFPLAGLLCVSVGCGDAVFDESLEHQDQSALPVLSMRVSIQDPVTGTTPAIGGIRYLLRNVGDPAVTDTLCQNSSSRTDSLGRITLGRTTRRVALCLGNRVIRETPVGSSMVIDRSVANYLNILRYVQSWNTSSSALQLSPDERKLAVDFAQPVDVFERSLAEKLLPFQRISARIAIPSMGVNLSAHQTGSPLVGESMWFVDVFRTARPFSDQVPSGTTLPVDANGWPTSVPPGMDVYTTFAHGQSSGIPSGTYTVIYDGEGELSYGGIARLSSHRPGRDIIQIKPKAGETNFAELHIKTSNPSNYIRNIRVVMPGGTCKHNPMVWVSGPEKCMSGQYVSFVARLTANRNEIVFHPDFLWFLKDFSVLRFAKPQEVSPHVPAACKLADGSVAAACTGDVLEWSARSTMNNMSFGGSPTTPIAFIRPVPVEVMVALANAVQASPWFALPPQASDDYVAKFAQYTRQNLHAKARVHLELGNEVWNSVYMGYHYAQRRGLERGYGAGDRIAAGRQYYVRRSVEMFNLWRSAFGADADKKLYRVISGYQRDGDLATKLLSYVGAGEVDAFGVAPYFYGCYKPVWPTECTDRSVTPYTYFTATSVDQVFEMLKNPRDPFGIDTMFKHLQVQADLVHSRGLDFVAYEGGQSLRAFMVDVGDAMANKTHRDRIAPLFTEANRDPRMGELYRTWLARWNALGGKQVVWYAAPETYSHFGHFGLSEHLTAPRSASPKYKMVMDVTEGLVP